MNGLKIFGTVLACLAAGAAIGALYAPDKGDRNRKRLARQSNKFMSMLDSRINDNKKSLEALRQQMMNKMKKYAA